MGIQEIIVIILIGGALLYTIYGIINIFSQKPSGGCACSSCDLKSGNKELQALIHKKVKKEYS
jgi:hypothetical protein